MHITVETNTDALARALAKDMADYINAHPGTLVCLPAGDTPLKMMGELINLQRQGETDLSSAYYIGLDEWVGIGYETKGSCAQVMEDHFYIPAAIPRERICTWDGKAADLAAECLRMERWLQQRGGIGLVLVGVGMNGHIGFNEPGSPQDALTLVVDLDETTRQVGPKYFGGKPCPTRGVTLGIGALLQAETAWAMVAGGHKAPIMRKALMDPPSLEVPASVLQRHSRYTAYVDEELFRRL